MSVRSLISEIILVIILLQSWISISGQTDKPLYPQLLFPAFTKGIIKMKAGNTYSAILNYNIVDEEMLFDQKGTYMVLEKPEEIDTVFMHNRKFVPVGKVFYEVVVQGPVSLYIQHKGRYASVAGNTAYGMTSHTLRPTNVNVIRSGNQVRNLDLPDNVKITPATAYWLKADDEMKKFATAKQLLKLLPSQKAEVSSFIKNNKINIKSREDLIRLGNYCTVLFTK